MSDAGEFVDAALQREGDWYRADDARERLASSLSFYGASTGAVRGAIRDMERRYPALGHDEITALSSELWSLPVFERRQAAVVLLQSGLGMLRVSDLTRMEGFVRGAGLRDLVDPLATDVIGPLIDGLDRAAQTKARVVLDRWVHDPDVWLSRAALLSPLRALKAGRGDWDWFARHAKALRDGPMGGADDRVIVGEAIDAVEAEVARSRPDLTVAGG
ncbi:DNA alkylation repair protein [Glaciihabitans sp. dw_435]|uniref:DNA alkylation repair protein n=1 Tax=Glaciihabitans sp. dw_435 TaxID=2720081 RepID=UPI001BD2F224|nr:DNA alkylation repair protein [Glaciihabitans sp. dw_435]